MLWQYPEEEALRLAPLVLAYVGDAVFELFIRCHMVTREVKMNRLHRGTISLVSAKAMAKYYKKLEPLLSEREAEVLRRGRNVKTRHHRNTGIGQYHMSTGFEALVGYLFLSGQEERLEGLLRCLLEEEHGAEEKGQTTDAGS